MWGFFLFYYKYIGATSKQCPEKGPEQTLCILLIVFFLRNNIKSHLPSAICFLPNRFISSSVE